MLSSARVKGIAPAQIRAALRYTDEMSDFASSDVDVDTQRTTQVQGDPPESTPDELAPGAGGADAEAEISRAGIEHLFREYNDFLVRVLSDRLRSAQEAREVAQEAYVRLLGLHNPGAAGYLKALLFRTAINIANDRLRHKGRKERLEPLVFFHTENEHARLTPDQEYLVREELDIVRSALEELPPKCREVFLLHRLDGLTVKEAAARMDVSTRQGLRYIDRALEHCLKKLEEHRSLPGSSE